MRQQHRREEDEAEDADDAERTGKRRRDEDGTHGLSARDRAVPAEGDGAPAPVRHAGSGLDDGLGVGFQVVGILVELFRGGSGRCGRGPHVGEGIDRLFHRGRGGEGRAAVEVIAPTTNVRDDLQLRKDHRLDLARGEGGEGNQEDGRGGPFASVREIPPATRREHGDQSHGDEQQEPRETRRAGLVIGEAEGGEGEQSGGKSPQSENGEGEEQEQKEIEERP